MNKPVEVFRDGSLEAAVWKNSEKYFSVSVSRSFKDKEGLWQRRASFGYDDIPKLVTLLQDARQYITNQRGMEGVKEALGGTYETEGGRR